MHVLEQAVLDAVGRDEHHAGDVPLVGVHQRAHGLGAGAGDALDVVAELDRAAAEGCPASLR